MSEIAIRYKGLSKQYRIGKCELYQARRNKLTEAVYTPFRKVRAALNGIGWQPLNGFVKHSELLAGPLEGREHLAQLRHCECALPHDWRASIQRASLDRR